MERITKSREETYLFAEEYITHVLEIEKRRNSASAVALYGDLGSGKTTFVQGVARALGIKETIISPTFVIERIYKTEGEFSRFVHIDCYRLEDSSELQKLDWKDLIEDPHAIIFIEWAEKIEEFLPESTTKIYFELMDEKTRKIKISY